MGCRVSVEDVYGHVTAMQRAALIEEHLQKTLQEAKTALSGPQSLSAALRVDLALQTLEMAVPRLLWLGWVPAAERKSRTEKFKDYLKGMPR